MKQLLQKSKQDFNDGVTTNGEHKAVDFFISELVDSTRKDSMLIRPSQVYGVLKLLQQKVSSIQYNVTVDYPPSYDCGILDEVSLWDRRSH